MPRRPANTQRLAGFTFDLTSWTFGTCVIGSMLLFVLGTAKELHAEFFRQGATQAQAAVEARLDDPMLVDAARTVFRQSEPCLAKHRSAMMVPGESQFWAWGAAPFQALGEQAQRECFERHLNVVQALGNSESLARLRTASR